MSFRVAISGLKAASSDLGVIANNVSNAATNGFKKSRAEFADVFAVNDLASNSSTPGSGVRLAAISQQFTQGNITFTDNNLDLAISGRGFFVVDDGGTQVYTRAGSFGVDRDGFLSNSQGKQLIAFAADTSGNITGAASPLQINTSTLPPAATTTMDVNLNLDASETQPAIAFDPNNPASFNHSTSTNIIDTLGNTHLASLYFRKTATANQWESYAQVDGVTVSGPDTMQFSTGGILTAPALGVLTVPAFTPAGGGGAINMDINFPDTTQFGGPFSVNALAQDGFATGRLSGLDIAPDGVIFARFTNGQSRVEGQLAMADFANPQGLSSLGDTTWGETFASGAVIVGAPGTSSLGLIQSGALEDSNVEISEELVNMIIAQRSFQANAEVISTTDAITQSIINLR